ncbi:hypothetical protein QQ008_27650 [Fulvivirgaceae bacterium BMA10]|uniref:Uncharacterized protein n=1 Tax=Splendidivirga corallicola TaxID=3051826 RepID=A0ABT8KWP0_9BACT|nr:hypothetical protein [Fulvivirgaceae bacterium BMA10]
MKKLLYIYLCIIISIGFASCEDDILFDTIEVPAPQVTDANWSAEVMDGSGVIVNTGFAEGGRVFRLPNPLDETRPWRDIRFQATINSNDSRQIDSISVELQWIPSLPSNAAQGWLFYEGIKVPDAERSSSYSLDYAMNLDEWSDSYVCQTFISGSPGCGVLWIAQGVFGITREDNTMRLTVHFDDGSQVRLAQVQFSYFLTDAGVE